MTRLKFFLFLTPLFFYSCVSGSIYSELANNLRILISGPEDISAEKINSIPYASLQVSLGKGNNSLMILEEDIDGTLKWTSSNLIKMYTKNGIIVKFKGLDNELDQIEFDKSHPIYQENFAIKKDFFTSFYTFNNPKLFRLPVKTKFNLIGREEVEVLGTFHQTRLYEEVTLPNLISWKFRNLYWIDESGFILKSRQNFTPRNPEINILVTKKYKKPE